MDQMSRKRMKSALGLLFVSFAAGLLPGQTQVRLEGAQKDSGSVLSGNEMNVRAYIELLRTDLKQSRTQVVGLVMQLDADDATKFWPIYKEFEAEYQRFGDEVVALVRDYVAKYDNMTPQIADRLANKLLDLEQQRTNLKRKYYLKIKAALDPIVATRFLQVENQIERILDLQIASELPVIESPERSQQ
jgi:hypothetical protein